MCMVRGFDSQKPFKAGLTSLQVKAPSTQSYGQMKGKKSNGKDGLEEAKGKNMGLQLKEEEENKLSRQLRNCLLVTKE